jgi:multisubunit Na+/H+ antiporter MnhG subunit
MDLQAAAAALGTSLFVSFFVWSQSGGVYYLICIQQFIAAIGVAARAPDSYTQMKRILSQMRPNAARYRGFALLLVAYGVLVSVSFNASAAVNLLIDDRNTLQTSLKALTSGTLGHRLKMHPTYQFLQTLANWDNRPSQEKKERAIYIPQSYGLLWSTGLRRAAIPLVVPALSGSAMIYGLVNPTAEHYYGYFAYPMALPDRRKSDHDLCDRASRIPARIILQPDRFQLHSPLRWIEKACPAST